MSQKPFQRGDTRVENLYYCSSFVEQKISKETKMI